MFVIEKKSNFHPNWTISQWTVNGGYPTKEEAEIQMKKAVLDNLRRVQSTSFSFRVIEYP
jgi:hypothetical protein